MAEAEAAVILRNQLDIRLGLLGGYFNIDIMNRGYARISLLGKDFYIIDVKVAFQIGFTFKPPIPTDALLGAQKAFGNFVGKVRAIGARVLEVIRTAERFIMKVVGYVDKVLEPTERVIKIGYMVADMMEDTSKMKEPLMNYIENLLEAGPLRTRRGHVPG
jgi:hypothetical protein